MIRNSKTARENMHFENCHSSFCWHIVLSHFDSYRWQIITKRFYAWEKTKLSCTLLFLLFYRGTAEVYSNFYFHLRYFYSWDLFQPSHDLLFIFKTCVEGQKWSRMNTTQLQFHFHSLFFQCKYSMAIKILPTFYPTLTHI